MQSIPPETGDRNLLILFFSLLFWGKYWLRCVMAVEKWHHPHTDWFPYKPWCHYALQSGSIFLKHPKRREPFQAKDKIIGSFLAGVKRWSFRHLQMLSYSCAYIQVVSSDEARCVLWRRQGQVRLHFFVVRAMQFQSPNWWICSVTRMPSYWSCGLESWGGTVDRDSFQAGWLNGKKLLLNRTVLNRKNVRDTRSVFPHQLAATLKSQTVEVNNIDGLVTLRCSAGKQVPGIHVETTWLAPPT